MQKYKKYMCKEKYCYACKTYKLLNEFYKHKGKKDGLSDECKICKNILKKQYHKNIKSNPFIKMKDGTPNWAYNLEYKILKTNKRSKINCTSLITKYDIIEKFINQNGQCYYTGLIMDLENHRTPLSISVDRVDSKLPYSKDNTVLCCLSANLGKNMFTEEEYINFITLTKNKIINNKTLVYLKENGNFVFDISKGNATFIECTPKGEFVSQVSVANKQLIWVKMEIDFEDLKTLCKFPIDETPPHWEYIKSVQISVDEDVNTFMDIFGTMWFGELKLRCVKKFIRSTDWYNELNGTESNAYCRHVFLKNAHHCYYTDSKFKYLEEISIPINLEDLENIPFIEYENYTYTKDNKVKSAITKRWMTIFKKKLNQIF